MDRPVSRTGDPIEVARQTGSLGPTGLLRCHPGIDPLFDLMQAADQDPDQGEIELGVPFEQRSERVRLEPERSHALDDANGCHPSVACEWTHLTEDVSRPEPVEPAAHVDLRLAFEDHEDRIGRIASLEDGLAGSERHVGTERSQLVDIGLDRRVARTSGRRTFGVGHASPSDPRVDGCGLAPLVGPPPDERVTQAMVRAAES